jgi:hypothetical protein
MAARKGGRKTHCSACSCSSSVKRWSASWTKTMRLIHYKTGQIPKTALSPQLHIAWQAQQICLTITFL